MEFIIQEVSNSADLQTIEALEDRVFRSEKQIRLPRFEVPPDMAAFRLIARALNGLPAGVISVVESNPQCPIFRRYGSLVSGHEGRSARFTRLAVLPEFRGHGLSVRLILEAQRRFIIPQRIEHTWLLFEAARAGNSLLSTLLAFHCAGPVIRSEYGPCRLLYRDELSMTSLGGNRRGWAYLAALAASSVAPDADSVLTHPIGNAVSAGVATLPPTA